MNDKDFEKLASTFGFAPSRALRELLDAATAQAALDEREACARILDGVDNYANPMTANDCAAAIRARSLAAPAR